MTEYTVDVTMQASIRLKAHSEEEAKKLVEAIQGYDLNAQFERGSMELTEISVTSSDVFSD